MGFAVVNKTEIVAVLLLIYLFRTSTPKTKALEMLREGDIFIVYKLTVWHVQL
jgi:hypothetical protein